MPVAVATMPDQFPIFVVPDDAAEEFEAMGSKPKFWYQDAAHGPCLFKQSRPGTGEDWAEKIASELAALVGLPCARVDLALWRNFRGTVSPTFVPPGGSLIHGNEILPRLVQGYPALPGSTQFSRVPQHTVEVVLRVNEPDMIRIPLGYSPPAAVLSKGQHVLVGYLLLDAWIGNTDRHHGNWAWILQPSAGDPPGTTLHLAPTFDHASSLGRNESDGRLRERLTTTDAGFSVEAYAERAPSAFFAGEIGRPLTTFEAFRHTLESCPRAARAWIEALAAVRSRDVEAVLRQVPTERMSQWAVAFAMRVLGYNQARLADLLEQLA